MASCCFSLLCIGAAVGVIVENWSEALFWLLLFVFLLSWGRSIYLAGVSGAGCVLWSELSCLQPTELKQSTSAK